MLQKEMFTNKCSCCINIPNVRILSNRKNQIKIYCICGFAYMYDVVSNSIDTTISCPRCSSNTYTGYALHSGGHFNAVLMLQYHDSNKKNLGELTNE